jgi:hypothetical protein
MLPATCTKQNGLVQRKIRESDELVNRRDYTLAPGVTG